jgi:DNA-binding Xre family transcriptional regulator
MAQLIRMSGITDYSARLLGKDQDVSTEVLTKVCAALGCEVQDIVDFLPEAEKDKE